MRSDKYAARTEEQTQITKCGGYLAVIEEVQDYGVWAGLGDFGVTSQLSEEPHGIEHTADSRHSPHRAAQKNRQLQHPTERPENQGRTRATA